MGEIPLILPTSTALLLLAAAHVAWRDWPSRIAAWWWAGTCVVAAVAFGRRAVLALLPAAEPLVAPVAALCRAPWFLGVAAGVVALGLSAAAWRLLRGPYPRLALTPGAWAGLAVAVLLGWWSTHHPWAVERDLDALLVYGGVDALCAWVWLRGRRNRRALVEAC